jgi:hypothetical protein
LNADTSKVRSSAILPISKDRSRPNQMPQRSEYGPALKHSGRPRSHDQRLFPQRTEMTSERAHLQTMACAHEPPASRSKSDSSCTSTQPVLIACLNIAGGHRPPLQLKPREREGGHRIPTALRSRFRRLRKILFSRSGRLFSVCRWRSGRRRTRLGDGRK